MIHLDDRGATIISQCYSRAETPSLLIHKQLAGIGGLGVAGEGESYKSHNVSGQVQL